MLYLKIYLTERSDKNDEKAVLTTGVLTVLIAISAFLFYNVKADGKLDKRIMYNPLRQPFSFMVMEVVPMRSGI